MPLLGMEVIKTNEYLCYGIGRAQHGKCRFLQDVVHGSIDLHSGDQRSTIDGGRTDHDPHFLSLRKVFIHIMQQPFPSEHRSDLLKSPGPGSFRLLGS